LVSVGPRGGLLSRRVIINEQGANREDIRAGAGGWAWALAWKFRFQIHEGEQRLPPEEACSVEIIHLAGRVAVASS
jgi:hypothetical protein